MDYLLYHFTPQKENPFLKFVTLIPIRFTSIIPDFIVGSTTCCLFLSLKYHIRNPEYIKGRFRELLHSPYTPQRTSSNFPYRCCILLCLVNTNDVNASLALQNLNLMCVQENVTLILGWRFLFCFIFLLLLLCLYYLFSLLLVMI